MALKSTIYKIQLNVADTDRQVYGDFALTVARHPSETDRRMMLRLLVFALHADEALVFGRGISTDDEPDLWQRDATGRIERWIELGNPDPDRLRKACSRSGRVTLYAYGERATPVWWDRHAAVLSRLDNLAIFTVDDQSASALESLASGTLRLQCTVSEGTAWFSDSDASVAVTPQCLLGPDHRG